MNKLSRREFMFGVTAGACLLSRFPMISTKKTYHWNLLAPVPKDYPVWGTSLQQFAADVYKNTSGGLKINLVEDVANLTSPQVRDAVIQGRYQLAHGIDYLFDVEPASVFFSAPPGGSPYLQSRAWTSRPEIHKIREEMYNQHNLQAFWLGHTGSLLGTWTVRPIEELTLNKNVQMRTPYLGSDVYSRIGLKAKHFHLFASGKRFQAGKLDILEGSGVFHDTFLNFHKTARYFYAEHLYRKGLNFELIVNRHSWEALPTEYQAAFRVAAAERDRLFAHEWQNHTRAKLESLKLSGVQQLRYPREFARHIFKASQETLMNRVEGNRVATKLMAARKQS